MPALGQAPCEAVKAHSKATLSNGNMAKISAAAGFLVSPRRDKPREVGLTDSLGQQGVLRNIAAGPS